MKSETNGVETRGPRVRGEARPAGQQNGRAGRPALPFTIAAASDSDLPAIAALLLDAELPHEDFAPHLAHFLIARDPGGVVVGAIGAEVHAPDALLRSLVVAPEHRGAGLGAELVLRFEAAAVAWGVERWWLLTTTAERFFAARGFVVAPRENVPAAIQRTGQFNGGCCGSAVCLTRERRGGP